MKSIRRVSCRENTARMKNILIRRIQIHIPAVVIQIIIPAATIRTGLPLGKTTFAPAVRGVDILSAHPVMGRGIFKRRSIR